MEDNSSTPNFFNLIVMMTGYNLQRLKAPVKLVIKGGEREMLNFTKPKVLSYGYTDSTIIVLGQTQHLVEVTVGETADDRIYITLKTKIDNQKCTLYHREHETPFALQCLRQALNLSIAQITEAGIAIQKKQPVKFSLGKCNIYAGIELLTSGNLGGIRLFMLPQSLNWGIWFIDSLAYRTDMKQKLKSEEFWWANHNNKREQSRLQVKNWLCRLGFNSSMVDRTYPKNVGGELFVKA